MVDESQEQAAKGVISYFENIINGYLVNDINTLLNDKLDEKVEIDKLEYGTYINQRFQFKIDYPKELLFSEPLRLITTVGLFIPKIKMLK